MFKRKLLSKMGSDGLTVNQALKFNLITTPVPPRFNPYSYTPSNNRGTFSHAFLPPKTPFSIMRESFGVTTQTEQEPIKEENDVVQKEPVKLSMHTTSTHIPPEEAVKLSMHTTSTHIPPGPNPIVQSLNAEITSLKMAMDNLEFDNLKLTGKVHTIKEDLMKEGRTIFLAQKEKHLEELQALQSKVNELTHNLATSVATSEANLAASIAEKDKALNDEKLKTHQQQQTITDLLKNEDLKMQELRNVNAELQQLHGTWNFTVQRYVGSMIDKIAASDPDIHKLLEALPHKMVGSHKIYDQQGFQKLLEIILDSDKRDEYIKAIDNFMANAILFDNSWRLYEQNTKSQQWPSPTSNINPGLSIRIPEPQDAIMAPAPGLGSGGSSGSSLSSAPSTGSEPEKNFSAEAMKQKAIRRSERTRHRAKPVYKETTNRPSQSKKGKGKK